MADKPDVTMKRILEHVTEWKWSKPFEKIQYQGKICVPLTEVAAHLDVITDRVRRLLPLLEAGQAMRNELVSDMQNDAEWSARVHERNWDAAKQEAMKP
jgi:hypothetical protein